MSRVNWGALGRFAGALVTGDLGAAAEVLAEPPESSPPACAVCAEGKQHEPGAPACGTRDDGYHCSLHDAEGNCVMVKDAPT